MSAEPDAPGDGSSTSACGADQRRPHRLLGGNSRRPALRAPAGYRPLGVEAANLAARRQVRHGLLRGHPGPARTSMAGCSARPDLPNSLDPLVQIAASSRGDARDIGLAASFSTTYHPARLLADKFATVDRLKAAGGPAGDIRCTLAPLAERNFGSALHPEHAIRCGHAHRDDRRRSYAATGRALAALALVARPVLIQAGHVELQDWSSPSTHGEARSSASASPGRRSGPLPSAALPAPAGRGQGPPPRCAEGCCPASLSLIGSTRRRGRRQARFYRADPPDPVAACWASGSTSTSPRAISTSRSRWTRSSRPWRTAPTSAATAPASSRNPARRDRGRPHAERMANKLSGLPDLRRNAAGGRRRLHAGLAPGGGCDGFIGACRCRCPWELEIFVDQVVPILQRRGLFRSD